MKRLLFLLINLMMLTGCTGQYLVNYAPNALIDMQMDTYPQDELKGKMVLLGGKVADLQHVGPYTRVEIVRHRLSDRAYPIINQPIDQDRLIFMVPKRLSLYQNQIGDLFSAVGVIREVNHADLAGKNIRTLLIDTERYQFWVKFDQRTMYYDDYYYDSFNSFRFGYPHRLGVGFGYGRF